MKRVILCQCSMASSSGRTVGLTPFLSSSLNQISAPACESFLQRAPSCLRRCVNMRRIHSRAARLKWMTLVLRSRRKRTESTLGAGWKHCAETRCLLCTLKADCRKMEIAPKVLLPWGAVCGPGFFFGMSIMRSGSSPEMTALSGCGDGVGRLATIL